MALRQFDRVRAVHPHWKGYLRLSRSGDAVEHEGYSSTGTYSVDGKILTIAWEQYAPDVFHSVDGLYVHQELLDTLPEMDDIVAASIKSTPFVVNKISVSLPDTRYEAALRTGTSDIPTFMQIFVDGEYESPNLPPTAKTILDLGANIGLATLYFGIKFPDARIIAVEPETRNFDLLVGNTAPLGNRVETHCAAIWAVDGSVDLRTTEDDGSPIDPWGFQVRGTDGLTKAMKLKTLLANSGLDHVDILKVDIEGAELELFTHGADEWLPLVDLIIVETHERFRLGSDAAVSRAVGPLFEELPPKGENRFFRRLR